MNARLIFFGTNKENSPKTAAGQGFLSSILFPIFSECGFKSTKTIHRLPTANHVGWPGYFVGKYFSHEDEILKTQDLYYNFLSASQHRWQNDSEDPLPFVKYLLAVILAAYQKLGDAV